MKYVSSDIVFQEIPGEISLCFLISGCPNNCPGCHSEYAKNPEIGESLTKEKLQELINKYNNLITCVLFEGGEWNSCELCELLDVVKNSNLRTGLYTGLEEINEELVLKLDYLKTGSYIAELGGLSSTKTNQKLVNLNTNEDITYKFWRKND